MPSPRAAHPSRRLAVAWLATVLVAGLAPTASLATDRPDLWPTGSARDGGTIGRSATAMVTEGPAGRKANDEADARSADAPADQSGLGPSIHYEDALAHADDRIRFRPGGRVEVGFRPRVTDGWQVDGRAPRALPAGNASGAVMARAAQGSVWADAAPADLLARIAPVDGPAIDPATVIEADQTSAAPPIEDAAVEPAGAGLLRHVFGFLPYWELSDSSTSLNYDVLSTIAYFSVGADRRGNLLKRNPDGSTTTGWSGWTSDRMTAVINAAHRKRTRVVLTITVFAWTSGQRDKQAALLASPTARQTLARQAAAAVRDRGADGINLDFEPIASGYADEFTALVRTMRTELNRIAPGYQLTFDTTGYIGNYPIEAATAKGAADAIFVMGYDYRTAGSSPVGSIAPLGGPRYDVTDTVRAYLDRVPASKLILGVPYYGRAWSTDTSKLHARNISGTKYGHSTAVVYANAMPLLAQHGRRWDSIEKSAWTVYRRQTCTGTYGCVTSWRQLYVDDATALKAKYDTIIRFGLRGAGIWALGYDDGRRELNEALAQKFLHDTTGPAAGVKTLIQVQREEAFRVSWSAYDLSGVAGYDVQVSPDGGAWQNWLLGTKLTSQVYPAQHGHGYAFRVRARDRKGNVGNWNVTATWRSPAPLAVGSWARVDAAALSMRTRPTTSATKVGEFASGQRVSLVGGPVNADGYRWWQVVGPIVDWRPIVPLADPVWVAEGPSGGPYLLPALSAHATGVNAFIRDLSFSGAGRASIGPGGIGHRSWSPNGDGTRDELRLTWTNGVDLSSLELRLHRTDGTLLETRQLSATASGAQGYEFDGIVDGQPLPDGTYVALLVGGYGAGSYGAPTRTVAPTVVSAYGIRVDTVAPTVTGASASGTVLSPNGDGRLESVTFRLTATGATGLIMTVRPIVDGTPRAAVRTVSGLGPAVATWHGRTDSGAIAPDGLYRVTLLATDAAGNAAGRSWDVRLDTRPAQTAATASPTAFSPNGDGVADRTTLRWSSDEAIGGRVRIISGSTVVRSWTFTRGSSWATRWDGRNGTGTLVRDRTYTVRVDGLDSAGVATSATDTVVVDRTVGSLRWAPTIFYPQDDDRLAGAARIGFRLTRAATVTLEVQRLDGTLVRRMWTNRSLGAGAWSAVWHGRDDAGRAVPKGTYRAVLRVRSAIGMTTLVRTVVADAFAVQFEPTNPTPGQTLTVTVRTAELLAAAPKVTFTQTGRAGVVKTAVAFGGGRYRITFAVAAAPGPATLRIVGRDTAGGTNATIRELTVG